MFSLDTGNAPLLLGFALGMRHALDADHIVAMSTIVTRERSIARAALLGGVWGAGHSLSLLAVGLLVVWLRVPMSPLTLEKVGDTIHKLKFCSRRFFTHTKGSRGTSGA